MLPWLIGAAVVGVGAAIVSAIKDSSSDSDSSSSSDYDDRVEEAKKRERQAAIDNSQRQLDQKITALKSKWQIKDQFKNTLVSSKHNNNVSKSGQDKLIRSALIAKHEKAMNKLTNNIQELNSMLNQVTGELKAAGISLSHTAIQDQSATPSATKAQETKAKAKTSDNTKDTATKVASKAKDSEPVKAESKAKAKSAAKASVKSAEPQKVVVAKADSKKAPANRAIAQIAAYMATTAALEVEPKSTCRAIAQIAADMATKDASFEANSKRVAKKAPANSAIAQLAAYMAATDALEVEPKRTRRTKAQIEADMATKDASSDANSKSVAKKATTKRQRINRA